MSCPFSLVNFSRRSRKLASTHSSIALSIWATSTGTASFKSSCVRSLCSYTRALRYPHKKYSQGDWGGQGVAVNLEMGRLPKRERSTSIDALAVWAVALSSWNHTHRIGTYFRSISGKKKLIISVLRSGFTVTAFPLSSLKKKKRNNDGSFTNRPSLLGCVVVLSDFQEPNNNSSVDSPYHLEKNELHYSLKI